MSKIFELPLSYRIVRSLIIRALHLYYDEIIVTGTENIPTKGGFIFAPNHRNALMDALAVILISPKKISTSFLARADIFKNKKLAAFLRSSKIMPAFRIRDGFENLDKNNLVFEECIELLEANHALCIMPEGNQELAHKVRPLVKGIFRVAFSVQLRNKTENPVQILPVGFDYGHPTKFGKHLIINIGKPINVADYMDDYAQNPPKALNEIKDELKKRLETLTLHIDSEKNYDTILSAIDFSYYKLLKNKNVKPTTFNIYETRKQTSDKLCELEKSQPETLEKLGEYCTEYKNALEKNKTRFRNVDKKLSTTTIAFNALGLLITLPFALIGFVLNFLPFFLPVYIRKLLKVKFEGFFSSIQFVLGLILFPILYFVQSSICCEALSVSAFYIPVFMVMHLLLGVLSYKCYKLFKCTTASIRYILLPKKERKHLKKLRNRIVDLC